MLIIEDAPSISNVLYVLLEGLDYDGEVAVGGQQALTLIGRESFDAILLDLRYSNDTTEEVLARILEIQPNLVGRVLVITGEANDPKTLELIERHCLPQVAQSRLLEDILPSLQALWAVCPKPSQG